MDRSIRLPLGGLTLALILTACCAPAGFAASTVSDPTGDYVAGAPCKGLICEPWQDITGAEITHAGGGLHLEMTLLAPIPAQPALPPAIKKIIWAWRLDTDPAAFPSGYPLPNGVDSPFEVIVGLEWDGLAFSGKIIDRRPLLTGGEATETPIVVSVSGNQLSADTGVSVALPAGLRWRASTNAFMAPGATLGQYGVDNTSFATLNPGD